VLCAVIWLYLYLYLPETKGRSVESITLELRERAGEVKEDLRKVDKLKCSEIALITVINF
jgi:hypothetical protein